MLISSITTGVKEVVDDSIVENLKNEISIENKLLP